MYTEPHGSVYERLPRCLVRRTLGRHSTRRSRAARTCRRVDHGSCREVPHDAHGNEEACGRPGRGGARHHGEGRARADLHAWLASTGGSGSVDREVPTSLERTLRGVGHGYRGTETKGKRRWSKKETLSPLPRRTARPWNGRPTVSSS